MKNVHNLVRGSGIPALAYPATDASLQWPCTLRIRHAEPDAQITASLGCHIQIHGVKDEQLFTFRLEGDIFCPARARLRVSIFFSQLNAWRASRDMDNLRSRCCY